MSPAIPRITSVEDLLDLLRGGRHSAESTGREAVDHLAHGLQCAQVLSASHADDLELQVAGLIHDIGHLLVPGDDAGHGRHGADAVRQLLGERVATLVELHVDAKRYLTAIDGRYNDVLSGVSTATLARQGGPMTAAEALAFTRRPHWFQALDLRFADDAAKVPGRAVPSLEHWLPVVTLVAERSR